MATEMIRTGAMTIGVRIDTGDPATNGDAEAQRPVQETRMTPRATSVPIKEDS